MPNEWHYYDKFGAKQGPVDSAGLRALAEHGIVRLETVLEVRTGEQRPARLIKGLFPDDDDLSKDITPPNRNLTIPDEKIDFSGCLSIIILVAISVIFGYSYGWKYLLLGMSVNLFLWWFISHKKGVFAKKTAEKAVDDIMNIVKRAHESLSVAKKVSEDAGSAYLSKKTAKYVKIVESSLDEARYLLSASENNPIYITAAFILVKKPLLAQTMKITARAEEAAVLAETASLTAKKIAPKEKKVSMWISKQPFGVGNHGLNGETLMHLAAREGRVGVMKSLLRRGEKPAIKDIDERTPLFDAALNGHVNAIQWLCKQPGVDVNARNAQGGTPILSAVSNGHIEAIECLINLSANTDIKDNDGENLIFRAVRYGQVHVLQWLKNKQHTIDIITQNGQFSPIHIAALNNQLGVLQWMKDQAAFDIELPAQCASFTPLAIAASQGHIKVIEWLIDNGAKIDATDENNHTPLFAAVYANQIEAIEYLIKRKANVNATDKDGCTPLFLATCYKHTSIDLLRCLINNQANIEIREHVHGMTPLINATLHNKTDIMRCLIELGGNYRILYGELSLIHIAANSGHVEAIKLLLEKDKALLEMETTSGKRPLYFAAFNNHKKAIEFLIQQGADINARDNDKVTARQLMEKNELQNDIYKNKLIAAMDTIKSLNKQLTDMQNNSNNIQSFITEMEKEIEKFEKSRQIMIRGKEMGMASHANIIKVSNLIGDRHDRISRQSELLKKQKNVESKAKRALEELAILECLYKTAINPEGEDCTAIDKKINEKENIVQQILGELVALETK